MPTSPTTAKAKMRLYESYISPSPKTHMILKAPLSRVRQRTWELVDQITGATVPAETVEEEKRMREEKRKWRCRACKVAFAGERELNKHFHLFPAHLEVIEARRQGRKPSLRHTASASADLSLAHHASDNAVDELAAGVARMPRPSGGGRPRARARTASGDLYTVLDSNGPSRRRQESDDSVIVQDVAAQGRARRLSERQRTLSNEDQGRRSAARAEQDRDAARELARAAHAYKEQEERLAREQATIKMAPPRRGMSENLVSVLRRTTSRASLQRSAALVDGEAEQSEQPRIQWDREAKKSVVPIDDVFFDAETGEVVGNADDDSDDEHALGSVHGETAATELAPTMVSFRSTSSTSRTHRSRAEPHTDPFGKDATECVTSSAMSPAPAPPPVKEPLSRSKPKAWPSSRPTSATVRTADEPPKRKALPTIKKPDWVPSSRPSPTVPSPQQISPDGSNVSAGSAGVKSKAIGGSIPPLLPPIQTSEPLLSSLLVNDPEELTTDTRSPPLPPRRSEGISSPVSPGTLSPAASPIARDSRPARPRRDTNPFRSNSSSELAYMRSSVTDGASPVSPIDTHSPLPAYTALPASSGAAQGASSGDVKSTTHNHATAAYAAPHGSRNGSVPASPLTGPPQSFTHKRFATFGSSPSPSSPTAPGSIPSQRTGPGNEWAPPAALGSWGQNAQTPPSPSSMNPYLAYHGASGWSPAASPPSMPIHAMAMMPGSADFGAPRGSLGLAVRSPPQPYGAVPPPVGGSPSASTFPNPFAARSPPPAPSSGRQAHLRSMSYGQPPSPLLPSPLPPTSSSWPLPVQPHREMSSPSLQQRHFRQASLTTTEQQQPPYLPMHPNAGLGSSSTSAYPTYPYRGQPQRAPSGAAAFPVHFERRGSSANNSAVSGAGSGSGVALGSTTAASTGLALAPPLRQNGQSYSTSSGPSDDDASAWPVWAHQHPRPQQQQSGHF